MDNLENKEWKNTPEPESSFSEDKGSQNNEGLEKLGISEVEVPIPSSNLDTFTTFTTKTTDEINRLNNIIKEYKERQIERCGVSFVAFLTWSRRRERIEPQDDSFYAYEESWNKARALIEPLKPYIAPLIYNDVLYSVGLHYIICEPYYYIDADNLEQQNPLYKKYNIEAKAYIISSASDESSSSSIHTTKSLNDGDFIMQDLLRTRYGTWVYSILEQLDIGVVLL